MTWQSSGTTSGNPRFPKTNKPSLRKSQSLFQFIAIYFGGSTLVSQALVLFLEKKRLIERLIDVNRRRDDGLCVCGPCVRDRGSWVRDREFFVNACFLVLKPNLTLLKPNFLKTNKT